VPRVVRINATPVKGLGLLHPEEVELTERGVEWNRRYYLIQGWRLYNGKDHGPLVRVAPEASNGALTLRFPGGREVSGEVELGDAVTTNFWGRPVTGRLVRGPWSDALSDYAAESLQLVRTDEPGAGCDVHVGTIVSRASCGRLGRELGAEVTASRGPAREGDISRSVLDPRRAALVLGWRMEVDLATGLQETVRWFLSHAAAD